MKFIKKQVEIEAIQWTGSNSFSIMSFVGKQLEYSVPPNGIEQDYDNIPPEAYTIIIPTLEGDMVASKGDWIIKGIAGEFYPCKPDIFEKTYEEIKDSKKTYVHIKFKLGSSIEDAVNELFGYKQKGELVYGTFNGVKLESDTVTMDSAYVAITGKTKEEWDLTIEKPSN